MTQVTFFSSKPYEQEFFQAANADYGFDLSFLEPRLTPTTAVLADGASAVCGFVNDDFSAAVLQRLADLEIRCIALRCAGFNQVDLKAADRLEMMVARVPAYSPHAVAEHAVGLMLAANRHLHRAFPRVREGNFSLHGLLGFDVYGKTVGIVGTGRIGTTVASILRGFGCHLLAYDPSPNPQCQEMGVEYVSWEELLARSRIVTLHCPLTPHTYHLVDMQAIAQMQPGVMLVNTGRGGLIDTRAVIRGLKDGRIGQLALDVYEEEEDLFFEDLSDRVIQDDVFARLLTFPNVVITGHQAFFTREALSQIATITLGNIGDFAHRRMCPNQVTAAHVVQSHGGA